MIIPIYGPNGEVDEWLLIELQGDILSKTSNSLEGRTLGDLHFSQQTGDPVFLIGHHVLFGKLINLEKPMLITKKCATSGKLSYEIVSVIRRKLLFKTRPKPIISSVSKKV
ncbi:unnamed protein product [Heterobilharzia americana]|nr:unnamed protein product [Heterobilharzia americana]CAH8606819.1 unnamed protein product [Heterobilharzia americana]CAH8606833.1 unnamed protein product [Heterobilharzia americana]CAH8658861.1 unnamed protein product [Heterobilharzia americana]